MKNTQEGIGAKRLLVGAHYGMRDWLAQRITAIIMAVYTVILLFALLRMDSFTYESWAGLFANKSFKLLTFVVLLFLHYHVWIGVRDIWMDYVKPVAIRLTLHVLTITWLIFCIVWAAYILWRV